MENGLRENAVLTVLLKRNNVERAKVKRALALQSSTTAQYAATQ